jgi:hypothetical protein
MDRDPGSILRQKKIDPTTAITDTDNNKYVEADIGMKFLRREEIFQKEG